MNKSTSILGKTLETSLSIYQKIGLITLAIGFFSTVSYLTSYNFLFGYYFGGELNNSFSNFELFRRFVPFHINTLAFTWLMITLSTSVIIYTIKVWQEKRAINKIMAAVCFVIFHVIITQFFSKDISAEIVFQFGIIWLFPLFIAIMSYFMVYGSRVIFKSLTGVLFAFVILTIGMILTPNSSHSEELIIILTYLMLFSFGSLFSRIPYKKHLNFIFVFPYITIIEILLIISVNPFREYFNEQTIIYKTMVIFIIPLIVSYFLALFVEDKFKEKITNSSSERGAVFEVVYDVVNGIRRPNTQTGMLMFVILLLLGAFVMTPRVSVATAKMIRIFTPASEYQHNSIIVKDIEGNKMIINGRIVAEHDNVIFISNEKWELEQIKTDKYFVENAID
ncbi:hypothetical protein JOC86_001881 [Bacillus pakistanensis]|uniref:Uncharacterized protein n=1 Tax=Rossellomorea pakistanensis TaxID=992288 RepID=A0ABS2NBZ0_9BACI|nr:hypothetical protein [Bacillus pakistanensis]MBM7585339.1 hypothetical protein [Bacillus pakistanensis]